MFFAKRTKQRLLFAVLACSVYVLLVATVVALRPVDGRSFWQSFRLFGLGAPATISFALLLEALGTKVLSYPFWNQLPSWGRVGLLVVLTCLIAVGVVLLTHGTL